jgi:hypothetical protein
MTTTEHTTSKRHLQPHEVRFNLSKRIEKILGDSLHYFEEVEEEIDERHFDVDGILSGRPTRESRPLANRVTPARKHSVHRFVENAHILTLPTRGNFIPASHFAPRFA